jgi:uncharacterized repeat protein (TIGR01451 family)
MKKITLILFFNLSFLIFNSPKGLAQNVYIPDAIFKTALLNNTVINTNGDTEIQTSEAIAYSGVIYVAFSNISDMTGIEAFVNITNLDCSLNQLTSLNLSANTALQWLNCKDNQLTNLNVSANTALTNLDCSFNQLTSLNVSANTALTNLICSYNQLTSLYVSANTELTWLNCSYNQLTSLNVSANTALTTLYCYNNLLTSLDVAANTLLIDLYCNQNQLISIDVSANTALTNLHCNNNQLTSLNVSANTALTQLYCGYNQLTSLNVSANTVLTSLICYDNQLTSLDVSANTALIGLSCSNNLLANIDLSANTALSSLYCNDNQLTSLDLSANMALTWLHCHNNQLTSISQVPNVMNAFLIYNNNISCINNLPFVSNSSNANISGNLLLTCVPNQTNYSLGLPLCIENDTANNPNSCHSVVNITGKVYKDLNNNCTYNNTDGNTSNVPVKLYDMQNNLLQTNYTTNGIYGFTTLQPESYYVKLYNSNLPIVIACNQADSQAVSLAQTNQSITNINFSVECDTLNDVFAQSVNTQGWVFPGQVHRLFTNITGTEALFNLNCNFQNVSGTVTIQLTGPVTYVAPTTGALTPQVSGTTFTYNISNFNSLTPSSFGLQLLTDTTAQAGNQVCVQVTIVPNQADSNTANNTYNFCYNVVNSYDPNIKEVYPADVPPSYNDWFTYTIHFQNTGSAPAFNIRLKDTLDNNLDINTFEMLSASHTARTSIYNKILTVRFDNIMLPDSTTNPNGSMGYFQYRIKPVQDLPLGTQIKNTAHIYFDQYSKS